MIEKITSQKWTKYSDGRKPAEKWTPYGNIPSTTTTEKWTRYEKTTTKPTTEKWDPYDKTSTVKQTEKWTLYGNPRTKPTTQKPQIENIQVVMKTSQPKTNSIQIKMDFCFNDIKSFVKILRS